ncbi:hypothetical protein F4777DRAFT_555375 [Nemania sp. FL0916]|nr:hypothetical protein F4777DRAFT_555375 [Nemania sp. FL0916]
MFGIPLSYCGFVFVISMVRNHFSSQPLSCIFLNLFLFILHSYFLLLEVLFAGAIVIPCSSRISALKITSGGISLAAGTTLLS